MIESNSFADTPMSNKKKLERESLIDEAERLWIMGVRKPFQLMKILPVANWETANAYLREAERRTTRRHRKIDTTLALQRQLICYEQMQVELWSCLRQAQADRNINASIGAMNGLARVLRNEAELLGLQAPEMPQNTAVSRLSPQDEATVRQALEFALKPRQKSYENTLE